jgi:hypothetical protein
MQEQINSIEDTFQFLESDLNYEYFIKTPSSINYCKSINYYKEDFTIEIQIHKNLSYFYVNTITEKDKSFSVTSFNNKLIFCDDLNSENLNKAKIKIINLLQKNQDSKLLS